MKKAVIIILSAIIALGIVAMLIIRNEKSISDGSDVLTSVSAELKNKETTAPGTAGEKTKTDPNEDLLILVNFENPLPEDYIPNLTQTEFNQKIDKRAAKALAEMLKDCRAAGYEPLPCSGYRSNKQQQRLFEVKQNEFLRKGMDEQQAKQAASKWVALPGASEHHTGLAMDIIDLNYQILDEKQEQTGTQKWLIKHCVEYGFILRYPSDKKEITHINFEPWHYRYVGKENARKIAESGLCLEEYLEQANS